MDTKTLKNRISDIKSSTITKCILATIGFAGLVTIIVIAPNSLQMLELFGLGRKRYKPNSVYATFKRLQKQRFVDILEKGDKTIIKITEAGKKKLLEYSFDDMKIKKPNKWDGKWRIVGFDIPEKYKKMREALRHKLNELGFVKLQKSLFVHPYECRDEVEFIGEFFQIHKFITFIEADSISNDNYLKYKFNLY
ncbi:MAG: hypothetical protein HY773_01720 [Candidatus Terrybacteria bacterium]|nr:hypothetical protein [Candidatus Terrybacteria bacterium]